MPFKCIAATCGQLKAFLGLDTVLPASDSVIFWPFRLANPALSFDGRLTCHFLYQMKMRRGSSQLRSDRERSRAARVGPGATVSERAASATYVGSVSPEYIQTS